MFDSYITVNGPHALEQAYAFAEYYDVRIAPMDVNDQSYAIECDEDVENDICLSEEKCLAALQEIEAATGTHINIEDLEF